MPSLGTSTLERQESGRRLTRRVAWLAAALAVAVSVHVRWTLADLADWGLDEAATMWLAWTRLHGQQVPLGLFSSREIPNMAGAPLLSVPLALLSSPLSISRVLSLTHLAAAIVLARALWRRGASLVAVPLLALLPSLVLTSSSVWNQYYLIPLAALQLCLLVIWADRRATWPARQWALGGYAALGVLLPAVHLVGFADLAASGMLCVAALACEPPDRRARFTVAWVVGAAYLAVFVQFYRPWLQWIIDAVGVPGFGVGIVVCSAGGVWLIRTIWRAAPDVLARASGSHGVARLVVVLLWAFLAEAALLPFMGAQIGRRLILLGRAQGWLLLVANFLMVTALAPLVAQLHASTRRGVTAAELLNRHFSSPSAAAALIAHTVLVVLFRLMLMPRMFAGVRPDLLVSLVPAMLAPVLLIRTGSEDGRVKSAPTPSSIGDLLLTLGAATAAVAFYWLAAAKLEGVPQARYPLFVPGTEMTIVVDHLAAASRAEDIGSAVDVSYDLARGLDWVMRACGPERTWFTVGRQYDWLLLARHGLHNAHEGSCDRSGPARWQIGYRNSPVPPGMRVVEQFERLEIRRGL